MATLAKEDGDASKLALEDMLAVLPRRAPCILVPAGLAAVKAGPLVAFSNKVMPVAKPTVAANRGRRSCVVMAGGG